MTKIHTPQYEHVRSTDAYSRAKSLLDEKREVFLRLSEINRLLRDLNEREPDAVLAARNDVPFRNRPGRQKSDSDR
jgi:hypothetical protein